MRRRGGVKVFLSPNLSPLSLPPTLPLPPPLHLPFPFIILDIFFLFCISSSCSCLPCVQVSALTSDTFV